ncbi:MAG: hypothetical protein HC922_03340 [Leptolyngbyaceae cyanobacterium SM2_3_12]|nr:hypothetical protein [Leptolyngbyaceae cyanobacterium SM2_3_12]
MDSIQEQVIVLTNKVDALHQMIDQVNDHVSAILTTAHSHSQSESESPVGGQFYGYSSRQNPSLLDTVCEHKDILVDSSYLDLERQRSETKLSPDVQIQRLTAQLTAAYNRIAALEEQLLTLRVH